MGTKTGTYTPTNTYTHIHEIGSRVNKKEEIEKKHIGATITAAAN